jgi:dipeptidyl aminopeptidase/acylaminoacyl peptidase
MIKLVGLFLGVLFIFMISCKSQLSIQQDLSGFNDKLDGKIVEQVIYDLDSPVKDNIEIYQIQYLSDGLKVVAFIIKPKKIIGQLPVIIYNRGGNSDFGKIDDQRLMGFSYIAHQSGMVVIASQYRGTNPGEGKDEYGGKDVNDVLNLIPLIQSLSFTDTNNIFMIGNSRGGIMTYRAIQEGFKINAAIVMSSPSDLTKWYNERETMLKNVLKELIGGSPIDLPVEYQKRSVINWYDKLNVPLLIFHGENDQRVNYLHAKILSEEMEKANIEHKFILYPDDDHGLSKNRQNVDREIKMWIDKYRK